MDTKYSQKGNIYEEKMFSDGVKNGIYKDNILVGSYTFLYN